MLPHQQPSPIIHHTINTALEKSLKCTPTGQMQKLLFPCPRWLGGPKPLWPPPSSCISIVSQLLILSLLLLFSLLHSFPCLLRSKGPLVSCLYVLSISLYTLSQNKFMSSLTFSYHSCPGKSRTSIYSLHLSWAPDLYSKCLLTPPHVQRHLRSRMPLPPESLSQEAASVSLRQLSWI